MRKPHFALAALVLGVAVNAHAVVINEALLNMDDSGPNFPYYIELHGAANESLNGLSLVLVSQKTGSEGTIISSYDLNGRSIGSNNYFLLGDAARLSATYSVTPDIDTGTVPGSVDLAEAMAILILPTASIPNAGAGPLAGGETVTDGLDFNGASDSVAPKVWTNVPVVADDFGFVWAGFFHATPGADTNSASDITMIAYQTGTFSAGAATGATPTASPSASVADWTAY